MSGGAAGRPQSFLAFDFGLKRTGVATGNSLLRQASPLGTIAAEGDARFAGEPLLISLEMLADEGLLPARAVRAAAAQ